ncbi:MAG: hypothetical protein Q7S32_03040 [bacterium]|nr:hypothetical protein [bacterium]
MENKDNVVSLKEFKKEKKSEGIDTERTELGLLDIKGDLGIIGAFLGLPAGSTELEVYEAVLRKIEELRRERLKLVK